VEGGRGGEKISGGSRSKNGLSACHEMNRLSQVSVWLEVTDDDKETMEIQPAVSGRSEFVENFKFD